MGDSCITKKRPVKRWAGLLAAAAGAVLLTACSTTEQAKVSHAEYKCGFLGPTCAKLSPGKEGQASLRYVNPAAKWTQYKKIMIQPVTFWGDDQSKVSTEDQQTLVNYFYQVLNEELSKKFQIVDQPAPDAMKVQVAVTDIEAATPGLRSITMVVPQARLLGALKHGLTGSYPFVGGAQAEFKLTDSMTGDILAAGVDRRIGGNAIKTAAQWEWGDAENAMRDWAELATERLSAVTTGVKKPQ